MSGFTLRIFGREVLMLSKASPHQEQPDEEQSEMAGGSGHNFERREAFDFEAHAFGFQIGGETFG